MKKSIPKLVFMGITYSMIGLVFQVLFVNLLWASEINAQQVKSMKEIQVDVEFNNERLVDLFSSLEERTPFVFVYDKADDFLNERITIRKKKQSVEDILVQIARNKRLKFKQVNHNISVSRANSKEKAIEYALRQIKLEGKVIDTNNEPIPGASILLKGTSKGTVTDLDGNFSLNLPDEGGFLRVSFVGYRSKEIQIEGQNKIIIVLEEDLQGLEEVVVVAYGNTTKQSSTGAIQTVDSKELKEIPVAQFTQKLQGKFAGVKINQGTGRPGQGMSVQIRGAASLSTNSSPLYVVDGFPIVGNINNINPNEIETITVLKDAASTALYGSRAAFGVVLITTNSAKEGKTNINVNAYTGIQRVPQKGRPETMNGTEWTQFRKEHFEDLGQQVPEEFQNPEQYGKGFNWYDAMLRTGKVSDFSLTLNTNKDKFSSAVVAGYFNQKGVLLNSDYNRFSLRANTKFDLDEKVTVGVNVAPTFSYGNSPASDGQFFGSGGMLLNATLTPPVLSYQNEDGSYPITVTTPGITTFPTPNWVRSIKEISNKNNENRLISNGFVEYKPRKELKLRSSINIDMGQTLFHYFQPSTAGRAFASAPSKLNASLSETNTRYWSWLSENTAEYSKEINGHSFDILAGYTAQKYRFDASNISGRNFADDRVQTINAALVKNNPSMDVQEWSLLSYLSRFNYNYKHRYLFSASVRRDGSSRFGSITKWGNFPAVSLGWVVSEEDFVQELNWLSFFKLRGSYGRTGNNNIGNYTQYSTVAGGINVAFNNTIASGIAITNLGNQALGWEKTSEFDVGLDLSLFDDRISVTYDYYNKRTTDLLYTLSVPVESGFSNFTGNVGEIKFWGHELNINSNNLNGEFKWNTNFNISTSDNKVLALSSLSDSLFVGQGLVTTLTRVGGRIGQFYGLIQDGVYVDQQDFDASPKMVNSQVGTIKFRDVNGDGIITNGNTGGDKTVIGNPFPKFIFGFTNNFAYKDFDLSIVTAGSYGNKIAPIMEQGYTNLDGVFNVLKEVEDRWRSPEDPGDGYYGKTTGSTSAERDNFHTRFVQDGSYLSIKNITLGYTAPVKTLNFIDNLRFYASVQQAFVFTNYEYGNPEVGVDFNGNQPGSTSQGIDFSTYPIPRTFTFGVNVSLK